MNTSVDFNATPSSEELLPYIKVTAQFLADGQFTLAQIGDIHKFSLEMWRTFEIPGYALGMIAASVMGLSPNHAGGAA
ncbi:MAG: hypothetical protein HY272_01880 [Gammaproteobacteria bacterium]|nr:hypothetical protein [Gammaproteobacteria bacterium]